MRSALFILGVALLCLTGPGCSLFKKNTNGANGAVNGPGPAPAKFPGVQQDPLFPTPPPSFPAPPNMPPNQGAANTAGGSILAGTVMDAFHRPVGNAYIRWVNLDEKDVGAPIDVAADAAGHFIIQGVKPGASYKLIARTKAGEKMFAGQVLTSAPNVRVVIPIREDFANLAPPLPGGPAYQGGKIDGTAGPGWNGGAQANTRSSAGDPNLPATLNVPAPPSDPKFVPGIADDRKDRLPILKIPSKAPSPINPGDIPSPPTFGPAPSPGKGTTGSLDIGPTKVPSCSLVGRKLENLALRDTKGKTWEYRKDGQGKLVLIDFWGTSCIWCRKMMPTIERLNTQYGSRGLVVIGVALEEGKDERREGDRVNKACSSIHVGYRQLLGHVQSFDAGKQFGIKALPTLMLLDESGYIIFHEVGADPSLLNALERTIQDKLTNRAF